MEFSLKAQPSLRGWVAWALGEIVRQRQQTVAEVTSRIVEDWIDSNYEFLGDRYNVSLESFKEAAIKADEGEQKAIAENASARAFDENPSMAEKMRLVK